MKLTGNEIQSVLEFISTSPGRAAFVVFGPNALLSRGIGTGAIVTASGRLAQLVRALPSHGRGHWFESGIAHPLIPKWICTPSTAA